MGNLRCTVNGTLDDSKFNEPMPWIGIYVVAASATCAIAMFLDTFHGFRYRKFWFPSKFFALNATTLTLIGVAVKLSLDLNTSMPRPHEQLAKLSSTTFICTAIGNSMPSLGTMETKELMMNVVALGILVITVIVNICIQLGTRVIYAFWIEHAVVMFLMLILLAIMISSSLAIPKDLTGYRDSTAERFLLWILKNLPTAGLAMIADIMGACFTNLQHAISTICHQSTIEQREERVRSAILLLGETEKVLEILSFQLFPDKQ